MIALRRAGAAALLLAAACGPRCRPPAGAPPNVVLVTVDTLRADRLGCYGNDEVRTPNVDRLAAEGALFEQCAATTHVTVPSHLSILTSLPPLVHGVLTNDCQAARPVVALPALFARAGYRTGAFVGVKHLGPDWTLGPLLKDGLGTWQAPRRMSVPARAEETNRALFRWLHDACGGPFFAWVHYWDPHMPYEPPAPFDTAYYRGNPYDPASTSMQGVAYGWFFYDLDLLRPYLGTHARDVRELKRELGTTTRGTRQLILYPSGLRGVPLSAERRTAIRERIRAVTGRLRRELPLRKKLSDWLTGVRDLRYPLARYGGEVSYVDREIGRLRAELERLGVAGRTIVVVTADHGESLGEHGIWFDHFGLGEANLHVPLVVWAPGRVAPGRHADPATSLDVAPTVLRLAGLGPARGMRGRDLLASGAASSDPRVAISSGGAQLAVRAGALKLVRTLKGFYYVDGVEPETGAVELYDLATDPREQHDVAAARPADAVALGATLDAWLTANPPAPPAPPASAPAPDRERELRALGYLE